MSTVEFVTAGTTTGVGLGLVVLAAYVYRRWETPGTAAFAVFVALLGIAGAGTGVLTVASTQTTATTWLAQFAELGAIAWLVFALQYTGRDYFLTRRRLWSIVVAYLAFSLLPAVLFSFDGTALVAELSGVMAISGYMLGLVVVLLGGTLILQTTVQHGFLSPWAGLAFGVVAADPWFLSMVGFALAGDLPTSAVYALYTTGFLMYAVVLWGLLFRFRVLDVTAATQTLGRRAVMAETTDLIVVVDEEERVVDLNAATCRELDVRASAVAGESLAALFGQDAAELEANDDVELQTAAGVREFDAEVIRLRNRAGTPLGRLVSLRDVTERRQREQVLDVLNRLLRHNLRNELDVTKARTNLVLEELEDEQLAAHLTDGIDAVDSLLALAEKARTTARAFDRDHRVSTVDVRATVASVAATVREEYPDAEVGIDGEGVEIRTNEYLLELALGNVLENAIEHSTAETPRATVSIEDTADGARVRVDDNGPGIPAGEREAIERGRETPTEHSSGIGLWLVNWAITSCGGTVAFGGNPDGGRVELWVPDREEPTTETVDTSEPVAQD